MARRAASSRKGAIRRAAGASPAARSASHRDAGTSLRSRRGSLSTAAKKPSPAKRKTTTLASVVSALKARAAAARQAIRQRHATAPKTAGRKRPEASAGSPKSLPPIPRRSVVRKPPRRPTVRAARPAARTKPRTPRQAEAHPHRPTAHAARLAPGSPVREATADAAPPSPSFQSEPLRVQRTVEEQFSIPTGYGDDRIVLMVKDPWWLYAYWEIQPGTERAVRGQLQPQEVAGLQTVLRVHDVTGVDYPQAPSVTSFDISLSSLATNWFIHTNAPNRAFIVEIGLLTRAGRFLLLARSNRVTTPRFGPSDVIDKAWLTTDEAYWRLFGMSAGVGQGASPGAWASVLPHQMLSSSWSSVSMTGIPARQSLVRGFWCRVNTELVIHGATEPRTTVVVQGQPVTVRKDGTFSLRVSLPDGTQTITIEATSPDGRQTKTLTPVVTLAWAGPLDLDTHRPSSRTAQRVQEAPGEAGPA